MLKKTNMIFLLALLMSGCTREVYLQQVPCVDCEPCQEETCTELTPQCCPELAMQTEIQVYQVYDVPVQPIVYTPCPCQTCMATMPMTNCRTVCREVPINR